MLKRLNDIVEAGLFAIIAVAFGGMVVVVAAQVIARNILKIPLIWSLDLAQLLFAWCIFLGAAIALRRGRQYVLMLFPPTWLRVNALIGLIAFLCSIVVVWVMIEAGLFMTGRAANRVNQSLGISELWFRVTIPIGGIASALFLAEQAWNRFLILTGRASAPEPVIPGD